MNGRPYQRKCAIDIVRLAFLMLVATSCALLADESMQPAVAEPAYAVPLDPTIAVVAVVSDLPSETSPQSELTGTPSDTTLDAPIEVQIRSEFNDLQREFLEDQMKLVDWWFTATAAFSVMFAVIIAIVGLMSFKRFREIEIEARKGIEIANAVAEKAEIKFEEAKMIVKNIELKRDEAVSHTKQITSTAVNEDPAKAGKAVQSAKEDPSSSLLDRAISTAIEMQDQGDLKGAIKKWRATADIADGIDSELAARAWLLVGYLRAEQSRLREAITAYDNSIRLKPNFAEAFNNRGNAKSCLGQHDEAIADYDKAICLKSDFATALVNRAEVLFHLMRHDEARRDVETARKLAVATGDQSIVEKADELVKQFFGGEAN